MNQLPDEDDQLLVRFLRQNRPVPPPATTSEWLIERVEKPTTSSHRSLPVWAIGAVTAGVLLSWSGYRYWETSQQEQPLETFLVDSWNGTVKATDATYHTNSPEAEWLLLAPQPNSSKHP